MANERAQKWLWAGLAALVAVNLYFVRELIAAELLFAMAFGVLFLLWFVFFLAEEIGQRAAVAARRQLVEEQSPLRVAVRQSSEVAARVKQTSQELGNAKDMESFIATMTPVMTDIGAFANRQVEHTKELAAAASRSSHDAGRFVSAQSQSFLKAVPSVLANVRGFLRRQWGELEGLARKSLQGQSAR